MFWKLIKLYFFIENTPENTTFHIFWGRGGYALSPNNSKSRSVGKIWTIPTFSAYFQDLKSIKCILPAHRNFELLGNKAEIHRQKVSEKCSCFKYFFQEKNRLITYNKFQYYKKQTQKIWKGDFEMA